jgi:hypothetical protein
MSKSLAKRLSTLALALSLFVAHSTATTADTVSLDPTLDELLARFANTKAIGIFTKLSVGSNVKRLYKSFDGYHDGKRPPTIEEIRQRYDLMVQEMVMLVQNKDPELARDFHASRLLLWSYLSDPEKFETI